MFLWLALLNGECYTAAQTRPQESPRERGKSIPKSRGIYGGARRKGRKKEQGREGEEASSFVFRLKPVPVGSIILNR